MITLQDKLKNLDTLASNVNKIASDIVMGRFSKYDEIKAKTDVTFIPTMSIKINNATGGGFPRKRITIVTGNEDSGKTYLLLETIAKNQRENPNFVAGWVEAEDSITEKDLDLFGIDKDRFYYIEFNKKDGAEKCLDRILSAIECGIDFMAVNSLKALTPKAELSSSMEDSQIGLQARMNAKFMRKVTAAVTENNCALVLIEHLTTEIGRLFGDPLVIAGGKAIKYFSALILDLRKQAISDKDPISKEDGLKIKLTVRKNHVVTNKYPYVSTEYYAIFGEGTETVFEILEEAIELGILSKSGAYIKLLDEKGNVKVIDGCKMQWQGNNNFRNYCKANTDFFEYLLKQVYPYLVKSISDEEAEILRKEEEESEILIEKALIENNDFKENKTTKKKDSKNKKK